jgi:hypothetical protein
LVCKRYDKEKNKKEEKYGMSSHLFNKMQTTTTVSLIIDTNPSHILYKNDILDLEQALKNSKVLEVEVYLLDKDAKHDLSKINPESLILILSDYVSDSWRKGTYNELLRKWTASQRVFLVEMLPRNLRHRTFLGQTINATFKTEDGKIISTQASGLYEDEEIEAGIKLPLIAYGSYSCDKLEDLFAQINAEESYGYVIVESKIEERYDTNNLLSDNEKIVGGFRRCCSGLPTRQLAGWVMASPVITLPVVKLIQKEYLPWTTFVNLAEVFLSGIIIPYESHDIDFDTDPDTLLFKPRNEEIRKLILDYCLFIETEKIMRSIMWADMFRYEELTKSAEWDSLMLILLGEKE